MKKTQYGFTLIEIMVVIAIVAVLMGAVSVSIPRTGDNLLKEHAERFSALITLAQDEAILQSSELALSLSKNAYVYYRNEKQHWVAYTERPFSRRLFPAEITAGLSLEGGGVSLKDQDKDAPQVIILSSGEMTPFTYVLNFQNKSKITVKVSATGDIEKILDLHD